MRKIFNLTLLMCALAMTTAMGQIRTPAPSPKATVTQEFGIGEINLEYSRPSKKGRDIFGTNALVPYDKIWRTGANQATKISFSDDVMVEGKKLDAGSYAILTKPGQSQWAVHFYPYEGGNWGAYVDKDPAAAVMVKPVKLQMSFETFTIMFGNLTSDGATMGMMWDDVYIPVKISTDVDVKVMAAIDRVLAGPTPADYYAAGVYYLNAGKDLDKALEYVQKQTKVGEPRFWQLRQESLILAELGRYNEAIKVAEKSLALAKEAGNDDYVKMNNDSIAMWKKK
ncbi:DUF2911 domain-containing protein [Portibacter marinus]|uniref:DUF2911 domain-containing protein n=1 Tax=Portibacter marinus TaxID=2898660 RepID=UPI001F375B20|nr:DUF2911 domain-containing protein [Portibacter marinus]